MKRTLAVATSLIVVSVLLTGCPQSSGTPKTVPPVVGLTQAACETALAGASLAVGSVFEVYSDSVAAGLVVAQNPAAGTTVTGACGVDVVISLGPGPRTVPDVTGQTEETATFALQVVGLTVGTVTEAGSLTVAEGLIADQDPAAGTSAAAGAAVNLTVSTGAATVPDVVGSSRTDAATAIEAEGLVVGTEVSQFSDTIPAEEVISQDPVADTVVYNGSAVNLVASRGIVYMVDLNTSATKAAQDGLTWGTAFSTIEAGITAATSAGGEVWVVEETYGYDRSALDSDGSLVMVAGVDLYGGFAGTEEFRDQRDWANNETIIDGATARGGVAAYHVVKGANNAVIDGFTVQGGIADDGNALSHTAMDDGAGMYNYEVSPNVANCVFTDNQAFNDGGAIYGYDATSNVTNCTFEGNLASMGAGYTSVDGSWVVSACRFVDNAAYIGGGACINRTPTSMENCIFTGNTATPAVDSWGGALYCYQSTVRITNSTFNANTATGGGGALMNMQAAITATNCILWNNTGGELNQLIPTYTTITHSCVTGGYGVPADNNTDQDPSFFPADFRLLVGSPCINTGAATYTIATVDYDAPTTDIRGKTRPTGSGHDMGAYEMVDEDYVK
ncbi:MAG: PASTA domain-containing protein [bacterium]|nr:PASTA domain-containing protein [bacterium]